MAFSKITRIILFVIAGISLAVVLFFYMAEMSDKYDEIDAKVLALKAPVEDLAPVIQPVVDTAAADTTEGDSTALAEAAMDEPESTAFQTPEVVDVSELNLREELSLGEYLIYQHTSIALIWAYILFVLTGIAALGFPLVAVFSRPKGLIRLGLVLVAAAVIVIVSYVLSSDAPMTIIGYSGTANSDPGTLKMVDTTLFVTYTLFGIALLSILYSIISRATK
ncbi:MAG: hypothetical protein R2751_04145 [Bacteroidales bacterium]